MKSAIKKIYYGESCYQLFGQTKKWEKLREKSKEIFEKFEESLTEEQKRLYEELFEYECGQSSEELLQSYKEGFKLGLTLALEVFSV